MADGAPLIFEQLGGQKRRLALFGWDGPMGRPRQGAVLTPEIEVRENTTRYPGSKDGSAVTRHIFGLTFSDMELKGRLRRGRVQVKMQDMLAFVAEQQRVRVSWGKVIVAEGFIKSFKPGVEGANANGATEVEWSMQIKIDAYPGLFKSGPLSKPKPPTDYTSAIRQAFLDAQLSLDGAALLGSVMDVLNAFVEEIGGVVTSLASITDGLTDFKNAAFGTLNRIRGLAQSTIRKGQELRNFFETSSAEFQALGDRFNELQTQATAPTVTEQLQAMMTEARKLDDAADRAIVGKTKTTYVAKDGDTWESISSKFYGNPGRANDIRDANLAGVGEQVRSGQEYLIPV